MLPFVDIFPKVVPINPKLLCNIINLFVSPAVSAFCRFPRTLIKLATALGCIPKTWDPADTTHAQPFPGISITRMIPDIDSINYRIASIRYLSPYRGETSGNRPYRICKIGILYEITTHIPVNGITSKPFCSIPPI